MRLSIIRSFATFAALSSLAACGGAKTPAVTHRELAAYAGPIGSTDVALGATAFTTHCNDCHPGGEHGYGPKLNGKQLDPAVVRQHVREGKGRMPAFSTSEIDDATLEAIIAHLAVTGAVAAPAAGAEPLTAPPAVTP